LRLAYAPYRLDLLSVRRLELIAIRELRCELVVASAFCDGALRQPARQVVVPAALGVREEILQLHQADPELSCFEVARHRGKRRRRVLG
jgi:hypothetical protein